MPGTIDITIKTLDGNSRKFENISNGLTVKEFKEKIASKVGIAADQQRLISAGRVLNDESLLSSLNLDGQTIHLVERRPIPNQPPPATDTPTNRPQAHNQRPLRSDVPPWFGGAPMMQNPFRMQMPRRPPVPPFQGPRNVGPRTPAPPNLGRPATSPLDAGSNRVEHCRRFIDNAKHVLYHLKRLKSSLLGSSSTDETSQPSTSENEALNGQSISDGRSSGAGSAAGENEEAQEISGAENSRQPSSQGSNVNNRQLPRAYPASEIVSLHRLVRTCEGELQEYVDLCEQLMANESTEMSRETRRLHEKLVHGIGEATHFLAHAQHSLSDLFTDFTQQPRLSLAVPTPMGQLTTASIGIRNIVPGPHGAIRIPVPVAPPQFVEPFVPPHQRTPSVDNQETGAVTNAPPNAENSNTGPTYTNSFPHNTNPISVQFPPNANPINVQQFSVRGNPTAVIRASFRPMIPTTATTTRPSTLQENGHVRNDQSSQENAIGPTLLQYSQPTTQSQPQQHVFDARARTIGPRDPFVPCSSRFFNNFPGNPNQGNRANSANRNAGSGSESQRASSNDTTAAPNDNSEATETNEANSTDETNESDGAALEQSLQQAMNNMMGGVPGIAFEVNSNVVPVDPSRPIGEQIQQIINTAGLPGQMDPIAGQLDHILQTSLPLGPGMEATNIFFSDVQVLQDSMDPSDDQYSEEHDRSNENNQGNDPTRTSHAANSMENLFGSIMQGLLGQSNNQRNTPGQVPTLYDILRSNAAAVGLRDVQNSITTDISSCFCRSLSLANVFTLFNGDSSSLAASRPSFRRLIEETVLQGNEFSAELLSSRARHLVETDQALCTYSSASTAATAENVDMRRTINNFMTQRLCDLFAIGLNSDITDAQYCEQVHYSLSHSLHEFLVLVNAVLQPSQDIGNFLLASGGLMGAFGVGGGNTNQPGFNNILNSVVGQQLRVLSRTASSHVRVSDVEHFIVRTPSSGNNETSQNVTIEPMDVSDDTRINVPGDNSLTVRPKTVTPTAVGDVVESILGDEPPLNLFSNVPSETFPEFLEHTLQRDSEKEKQITNESQPFFSDAYLLGMPLRQREAAASSGAVGFSNSVPNLLNQALSAPQFSNISQGAREDMRHSVREDPQIDRLFAGVLRDDFRERAEKDPELRKRPSTKKFIDGS